MDMRLTRGFPGFHPNQPLLLLFFLPFAAQAQEELLVLNTDGTTPLISEVRILDYNPSFLEPILEFSFGFSTEEEIQPDVFLDSFTVTLQDGSGGLTAVYLTADRGGTVWAPPSEETIPLNPALISREAISFPGNVSPFAYQDAYRVRAPIPSGIMTEQVGLHMDLFDNGDGRQSLAWIESVTVVPEPAFLSLILLGLVLILGGRPCLRKPIRRSKPPC